MEQTYLIYIGRHGFSEANYNKIPVMEDRPSLFSNLSGILSPITRFSTKKFQNIFLEDPNLTLTGILQSEKTANIAKKKKLLPQYVFSSCLFRAIETSLITFPKNNVYIVPQLKEKTTPADSLKNKATENKPFQTISEQIQKRCKNPDYLKRLRFSSNIVTSDCKYVSKWRKTTGDIKKCLVEQILPFLSSMQKKSPQKNPIQIVLISHHLTISKFFDSYKMKSFDGFSKPLNNMIIQLNKEPLTLDQLQYFLEYPNESEISGKVICPGFENKELRKENKCERIFSLQKDSKASIFYKLHENKL